MKPVASPKPASCLAPSPGLKPGPVLPGLGGTVAPTFTFTSTPKAGGACGPLGGMDGVLYANAAGAKRVGGSGQGGSGPVLQGQTGVQRVIDALEKAGGKLLGREITLDVEGVRTRLDVFAQLPSGEQVFVEVKTGPKARLTPNQLATFDQIRGGGAVPVGRRAAEAGLTPGLPLGPTKVWIVYVPWP